MKLLTVDPEFKELLRALTSDEYAGLERSILEQGCLDAIKVWWPDSTIFTNKSCEGCQDITPHYEFDGGWFCRECDDGEDFSPHPILIDGHNRYKICQEHDIEFDITEIEFATRQDAINWIIDYQLEHRNLTPNEQSYLRGKRYNGEKQAQGGKHGNQYTVAKDQNDLLPTTAATIAKELKVSEPTIKRDAKFAEAVDALHAIGGAELKTAILTKELRATKQDVQELAHIAKVTPERGRELIQKVMSAKHSLPTALKEVKREEKSQKQEQQRQENFELVQRSQTEITKISDITQTFSTIAIDPPWSWDDEGDVSQLGRARPEYATMTIDQLLALPVERLASKNSHIYLWITNRSLPKGFMLLEKWGFRYVTCLTWCKPSIGMGNYFRGSTEQILFGIRGSLSIARHDVGTWFAAPRGDKHSEKPQEAYALIESCSPPTYLELFARQPRKGWFTWGGEL